jgi:acetoin utilization deacetylase AcuC-like enzyme
MIVSAGFDTYKADPVCDFGFEIQNYFEIAKLIKDLNISVTILQEGGYNLEAIGDCVSTFLNGFKYR